MDELGREFEHAAEAVFIYTREAHPGEKHLHHESMEDKLASARKLVERLGVSRRVLVDDLGGSVHRAFGMLPNMTYVVRRRGEIYYRAAWTDPRTVKLALRELDVARAEQAAGRIPLPYYMEWNPARPRDRTAFMEGLLAGGGVRAVEEYMSEAAAAFGEAYVKPLRRWWETKQAG